MSKRRVDMLLAIYDALNRGDMDAACAGLPPRFEFVPPPMLPEADLPRGPQGLRDLWENYASIFENYRAEVEETIEAGDQVIVMAAVAGTSASGPDLRTPSFAWVWTFEGETPVRMEAMPNRATALEAVGVEEAEPQDPA